MGFGVIYKFKKRKFYDIKPLGVLIDETKGNYFDPDENDAGNVECIKSFELSVFTVPKGEEIENIHNYLKNFLDSVKDLPVFYKEKLEENFEEWIINNDF